MISRERLAKANAKGIRRAKLESNNIDFFVKRDLGGPRISRDEWIDLRSKRLRKTTKPCSCVMCGNPRKHFGEKTLQEKRADLPDE